MDFAKIDWPSAGRYVLAVSGGADSMVLLDLFARAAAERHYELTVAHVDHGLRADSAEDATFVAAAAQSHGLPCELYAAGLGQASEAVARAARHAWLEEVRVTTGASAILTAHHQDDLLETSLLNLARGSGRRGLAPMSQFRRGGQSGGEIIRPLIALTRADLRAYAGTHHVTWREDPTNADITNSRNLLRHRILAAATPTWRAAYLELINDLATLNTKIDQSISNIIEPARLDATTYSFDRQFLRASAPPEVEEIIVAAARALVPGIQLDRPLVAGIAAFALTGRNGTYRPLRQSLVLEHKKREVIITTKAPR